MQYINPFDLLEITSDNLSTIDGTIIKKAKRKLLSELELNDIGTIQYHGIGLTKADCLQAIDDLDNKDKKEFHFFIFQNVHFNKFITEGKLDLFENYKVESIYKLPEFLDFVSPFFSEQYDKLLAQNIKLGRLENVTKILSVRPITNDSYIGKCYKSTYVYLWEIDADINQISDDIKNKKSLFVENKFNELPNVILERINVPLLNLLPSYFQNLRNQLAQNIRNLAVDINNEPYYLYKPAFRIIEIADRISTDGLVKQTITKTYYTIKQNYQDDIKKDEEEAQRQVYSGTIAKYNKIINQIDKVADDIDNKSSSYISKNFSGLSRWLASNINVSELNSLPDIFSNIRIRIVIQIKHLSVKIWNDYEKIEPSFELIQFAATIKVDEETSVQIKTDFDTLKEIEERKRKYGERIASAPTMSTINGIGTRIYGDTLYFVFFFIPVFPISRYSLEYDGYKSYRFLGKYKLYLWQKLWQWIFVVGIILLIIIGIINSNNSSSNYNSSNYYRPPNPYSANDNSNTNSQLSNNSPQSDVTSQLRSNLKIVSMKNGNILGCTYIKPKYDYQLNNKLIISVGENADVAVKMINIETKKCIRYVYIKKNTTYTIKNIPQAKYYLKIAYGDDWEIEEGKPIGQGRFMTNTLYHKSDKILDYNLVQNNDGWQVPSFSLKLNLVYTEGDMDQFNTNSISSSDFYDEE
jgi:hypothetical protein